MKLQEDAIVTLQLGVLTLSGSLEVFGSLEKPINSRGEEVSCFQWAISCFQWAIFPNYF